MEDFSVLFLSILWLYFWELLSAQWQVWFSGKENLVCRTPSLTFQIGKRGRAGIPGFPADWGIREQEEDVSMKEYIKNRVHELY